LVARHDAKYLPFLVSWCLGGENDLNRFLTQFALFLRSTFLLYLAWQLMMLVHETGHVFHALLSGGRGISIYFHPLDFSRTDVLHNPHPLFVVWGGPIWGALLPLGMWWVIRRLRRRDTFLTRGFAGFCLIVNGGYLGVGWTVMAGDAADLRQMGTPVWLLIATGAVAFSGGLYLWHSLPRRAR
jgi:hypothetical protein